MKKILTVFLLFTATLYLSGCSGKTYTITYKFNNEIIHEQEVTYKEEFIYPKLADFVDVHEDEIYRWTDGEKTFIFGQSGELTKKDDLELNAIYRYKDEDGLNDYSFDDDVATFVSYNLDALNYTIPNKVFYDNKIYNVENIASGAFKSNTIIQRIEIGYGITNIYSHAFAYCSNLKFVELPSTVKTVETYLFFNTNASVVTDIEKEPMTWILTWSTGSTVYWNVKKDIDYATLDGTTYIIEDNEASILVTENLSSFNIPNDVQINSKKYPVTAIGDYAFFKNSNLLSINIPNTIKKIGTYAFAYCTNLSTFTIPDNVDTIGLNAFFNSNNLIIYTSLSSSKDGWNSNWYNGCFVYWGIDDSTYTTIDGVTYVISDISAKTASISKVENRDTVNIKDTVSISGVNYSVVRIGSGSFSYNDKLENITIPSSIIEIGANAFSNCTSLKTITIPSNVTLIEASVFEGCSALTSVVLNANITIMNGSLFKNCTSLTTITIPSTVESIEGSVFSNCTSLTTIAIPNSVESIGASAFSNCTSLTTITIPNTVLSIGSSAFSNCTSLENVTLSTALEAISSNLFFGCTALTTIDIPSNVVNIYDSAFSNCTKISKLEIPTSVVSIGENAFYGWKSSQTIEFPSNTNKPTGSWELNCNATIEEDWI